MEIILFEPQIPQNTGNVVRTCKVTNSQLVLVKPLGFDVSDKALRRAGLDYWDGVSVKLIDNLYEYLKKRKEPFYFFSSHAKKFHSCSTLIYTENTALIFGSETTGLPDIFHKTWPEKFLTIPMAQGSRCLNLANSVAIALYEGLRSQEYASL